MSEATNGIMAPKDRSILILYGTETGNAQDIAEDLDQCAQRLRFSTKVEEMNNAQLSWLLQYSLVVFVVSTTGQGDVPRNASSLWRKLLRKKLAPGCLAGVNFTTFGLGDSSYPKFNWAARKLNRRMIQLGASEFFQGREADERHEDGTDGLYIRWLKSLQSWLLQHWPIPNSQDPIPEDVDLPPRFPLSIISKQLQAIHTENRASPRPDFHVLPVPGGRSATLVSNRRITRPGYGQDVRHITFDLLPDLDGTNVDLNPGDTISIYPENRPEDVQKLIGWMDWGAEADMSIDWHKSRLPQNLYSAHSLTLRDLLTRHLDITSVPKRAFLKRISYFTSEPAHKERLLEFTSPDYVDDYYDYTTRPRRTMLEVLQEFTSVKIPAGRALDTFPLIRGREFSIANGGFSTSHPTDPAKRRIEIVVALVRYKTILRKERRGLCSRYLEDMLPDGATITVLHKKTLTPTHGAEMARRPLVGIATGTGLAPIRSLIWERATHSDAAPMHLFFGFRNRQSDCHFRDEWVAIPNLVLHPAESRPSGSSERAYVQDLLVREAETVADVIRRDAIFFVCGGSHKMARAVRDAVMQVAEKELGAKSEEEQERVFEGLEWVQEIW